MELPNALNNIKWKALKIFKWKHCCLCVVKPHSLRIVPKFSFSWAGKTCKKPKAILGYKSSHSWPDHENGRKLIIWNKTTHFSVPNYMISPITEENIKILQNKEDFSSVNSCGNARRREYTSRKKAEKMMICRTQYTFLVYSYMISPTTEENTKILQNKEDFHRLIPAEMHGNTSIRQEKQQKRL